eukprot:m.29379 g.29379  ORF g.29379 m.29379 type:complete len:156 (-) comp6680_c0_seq1:1562-2029(-)
MGCCFSCCNDEEERPSRSTSPQEEQPLIDDAGNNANRSARSPAPYNRFVEAALLQHLRQVYARNYAEQLINAEEAQMEQVKRVTAIEGLPVTVCTEQLLTSLSDNAECTICMEDYTVGEELRFLPCMHMYHRHCVDDWLQRAATCPECNGSIIEP